MNNKNTYILKLTEQGLEILRPGEQSVEEKEEVTIHAIQPPRWNHWNQRKLARVWQATLLGMDIEPTVKARAALKAFKPEKYQIYRDRLDISRTLVGWELRLYEDHLLEGDSAGDKYVALAEYYNFAVDKGWEDMSGMRRGLKMDSNPPVMSKKKENYYLEILHGIFSSQIPEFSSTKFANHRAQAIETWLEQIGVTCPVKEQTLTAWVREMDGVVEDRADQKNERRPSTDK